MSVTRFLQPRQDGKCRVKVCGIRLWEDYQLCVGAEVDAVGLNFWPTSKRYVSPEDVVPWLQKMEGGPVRVGVFVNEDVGEILRLLEAGLIQVAQLHGDETPEVCARLRAAGHVVFKAIGVRDEVSLERLRDYEVDGVVLDAFCPGEYGGSGKTFNWELAVGAKEIVGECPLILSGGLTSANVAEAIHRVRPAMVDVASGVEASPGVKSGEKVEAFMRSARG